MNLTICNNTMMTLKEITDLLDVQHSKAMLKVEKMSADPEFGTLSKTDTVYNSQGQTVETYILDKRQSMAVAAVLNTALLMRVIDRWQELESAVQTPAALPDFSNPAAAARAWAEQYEISTAAQEQLQLAAPKIAFVDKYVESTGNKGFREVAKLLKIKEPAFRIFLADNFIMYQLAGSWTAYQKHVDAGRFHVSTGTKNEHAYNTVKFTPKGVAWIGQLVGEK